MSAMLLGFGAVGLAATVIAGRMAGEKLSPFSCCPVSRDIHQASRR